MSEELAGIVVGIVDVYLAVGATFAIPFVIRGVERIDPVARDGSWGFRVIIIPGVTIWWPLLAWRWMVGSTHPPSEVNAHRRRVHDRTVMP